MPTLPSSDHGQVRFTAPLADIKMSVSGDPGAQGAWTMTGTASVFDMPSHDMGGFRTRIRPGFFTKILERGPDVWLNREHDNRLLLARTRAGSLELTQTDDRLKVWARFSKTPLADETATLMSDGVLDQMSFACDIAESAWIEDSDGNITWELIEGEELYDVTICAQGAFPQTSSHIAASVHDAGQLLASARNAGLVAAMVPGGNGIAPSEGAADVARVTAGGRDLSALKQWAEARYAQTTDSD
jgi:HK97 family phage prohead protease